MRLFGRHLVGFLALYIGIGILFSLLGLDHGPLGALFLAGVGYLLYRHVSHGLGLLVGALAAMTLLSHLFRVNVGGIVVAVLFLYIGYRLFTGKRIFPETMGKFGQVKKEREGRRNGLDEEVESLAREGRDGENRESGWEELRVRVKTPRFRSSWLGDMQLIDHPFELEDLNLSSGIGDIKIDLSKAVLPEGESSIVISGFIGSVTLYLPLDLQASVAGSVMVGELKVLGQRQDGFNRQIQVETHGYPHAARRVKISVSLFLGSLDVRYL